MLTCILITLKINANGYNSNNISLVLVFKEWMALDWKVQSLPIHPLPSSF